MFGWIITYLPRVAALPSLATRHTSEAGSVARALDGTWRGPSDTRTILLIIGGDVIGKALAQLAGGRQFVPVAFSFGWVAYSFAALVTVLGDGRLLPPPDYDVKLFNPISGNVRDNRSWVLGRLVRDMERPLRDTIAINISIWKVTAGGPPTWDWYQVLGFFTIIIQLGIAVIPPALFRDWSTIMLTGVGIILSLLTGTLPQWHSEKYSARRLERKDKNGKKVKKQKVVALTAGNGSRNVFVIIDYDTHAWDLEDLAGGRSPIQRMPEDDEFMGGLLTSVPFTRAACVCFAIAWFAFLITWTGVDTNSWFLIAVGGLGMLQNVLVAGVKRAPSASGIHIKEVEHISGGKVMDGLLATESAYRGLGEVLLPEFFSESALREDEKNAWRTVEYWDRSSAASLPNDAIEAREGYIAIYEKTHGKVHASPPTNLQPTLAPAHLPQSNTSTPPQSDLTS